MKAKIIAMLCAAGTALVCTSHMAAAKPSPGPSAPPSPFPATLSLSQAEQIALASSPQLVVARATVDQQQATEDIARTGELPNVGAQATYGRSKSTFRGSGTFLFTQNSAAATLNQLITDGGRVVAQVQAARYSTDAAKLSLLRDIQTVLLTVAQQYYIALQARHQLEAAQRSLDVARVQEKLVEAQFRAGVASKADVLTAQLPVAQAELAVAQAQNGEASNVAALLTTIGAPATTPVTLKDDTSVIESQPTLDAVINSAMSQRTDLSAARASVSQAQAGVRAAKLGRFPVLGATASTGTASTTASGTNYAPTWSVGASLSFPVFDSGLNRAQTNFARAQEQTAEANLKTAQLNVFLTVQQAYLGLATARSGLHAANVELDQARVVLNVTNAQYKAGVTTLPLLLNAQSQLTKALSDQVNALYTYKTAQQQLLFAEGTLLPI